MFGIQTSFSRKARQIVQTTDLKTIVAPKGIYKTPHGYRVQLNVDNGASYLNTNNNALTRNASYLNTNNNAFTRNIRIHSPPSITGMGVGVGVGPVISTSTNNSRSKFSRNSKCLQEVSNINYRYIYIYNYIYNYI